MQSAGVVGFGAGTITRWILCMEITAQGFHQLADPPEADAAALGLVGFKGLEQALRQVVRRNVRTVARYFDPHIILTPHQPNKPISPIHLTTNSLSDIITDQVMQCSESIVKMALRVCSSEVHYLTIHFAPAQSF